MNGVDNQIKQYFSSLMNSIDYDVRDFLPLTRLCQRNGSRPSIVILTIASISLLLLLFGIMPRSISILIGLIYPAYMSIKAIQQNGPTDDWLTYWLIFGFMTAFDQLLRWMLFFLPAYYLLKSVFFVWLYYPKFNGLAFVSEQLIKPQLNKLKRKKFAA